MKRPNPIIIPSLTCCDESSSLNESSVNNNDGLIDQEMQSPLSIKSDWEERQILEDKDIEHDEECSTKLSTNKMTNDIDTQDNEYEYSSDETNLEDESSINNNDYQIDQEMQSPLSIKSYWEEEHDDESSRHSTQPCIHQMVNNDGETPLLIASKKCNAKAMKMCIENGANINHKDRLGNTCLHHVCMNSKVNDRLESLRVLVNHGAELSAQNNVGKSALHYAAQGCAECVALLLSSGSCPCIVDLDMNTPLHCSMEIPTNLSCIEELSNAKICSKSCYFCAGLRRSDEQASHIDSEMYVQDSFEKDYQNDHHRNLEIWSKFFENAVKQDVDEQDPRCATSFDEVSTNEMYQSLNTVIDEEFEQLLHDPKSENKLSRSHMKYAYTMENEIPWREEKQLYDGFETIKCEDSQELSCERSNNRHNAISSIVLSIFNLLGLWNYPQKRKESSIDETCHLNLPAIANTSTTEYPKDLAVAVAQAKLSGTYEFTPYTNPPEDLTMALRQTDIK